MLAWRRGSALRGALKDIAAVIRAAFPKGFARAARGDPKETRGIGAAPVRLHESRVAPRRVVLGQDVYSRAIFLSVYDVEA